MKILMVTMGLEIGGAETHIVELSRALSRMGHDITVASNGGVYENELRKFNIRHVKLPLNNKYPLSVIKSYHGLYKLIKTERFDIVHAHARIPAFICGLLEKRLSFRFVTTAHLDFKLTPLWQKIADWGEKTIAVSEDIAQYLISNYGVCSDNISLTINGIDMEKFSPDTDFSDIVSEFGLDNTKKRIVYISRIDSDRSAAAFMLVEKADYICKKYNAEIVIVGDGNDFPALSKKVEDANKKIGGRSIILTGARSDINKFAAAADIFIGVSRSVLEAMSASKPVVIAGNQGYLGIMDDSKLQIARDTNFCCRGCEMTNAETLCRDVCTLLEMMDSDKDAFAEMGQYNRSIIEKYYSADRMARDYIEVYEKLFPYEPYKHGDVIISGYYGFSNMGDDSLLSVIIDSLKSAAPEIRITALTKNPSKMHRRFGVKCINRFNIPKISREMKHAKLLISGGGSLLQDGTSTKSLFYYTFIMKLAHHKKIPFMLYANGIGPLYRDKNRRLAGNVVKMAEAVTLRDPESADELVKMGVSPDKIKVTADPAFLLVPAEEYKIKAIHERYKIDGKCFAVSLREGHNLGNIDFNSSEFESEVASACKIIAEKHSMTPIFIPMQPSRDDGICMRVSEMCGGKTVCGLSARELCGIMDGMEFVIGMRLHVLIYAANRCVPAVGLCYDPKIRTLMNYIGQKSIVDVTDSDIQRKIIEYADEIINNRGEICTLLSDKTKLLREAAESDIMNAVKIVKSHK